MTGPGRRPLKARPGSLAGAGPGFGGLLSLLKPPGELHYGGTEMPSPSCGEGRPGTEMPGLGLDHRGAPVSLGQGDGRRTSLRWPGGSTFGAWTPGLFVHARRMEPTSKSCALHEEIAQ